MDASHGHLVREADAIPHLHLFSLSGLHSAMVGPCTWELPTARALAGDRKSEQLLCSCYPPSLEAALCGPLTNRLNSGYNYPKLNLCVELYLFRFP